MAHVLTKTPVNTAQRKSAISFERLFQRFPSFWQVQLAGWTLYLVMMYVTFLTVAASGTLYNLFIIKLIRTVIGFFLTCSMRGVYRRFGTNLSIQRVVLLVLGCSIVFGGAWTLCEMGAASLRNPNFSFANNLARIPRNALDYGLTLTAWSALYFGIKYWREWQAERDRALAASALANQAQVEMLRYQINPHFLFNSLNSIRASIDEDAARAKQMVTQLAEFLRFSLLHNNKTEVALGEEIEAVRNYLAIEKTRFEDRLEVEFVVDEAAKKLPTPSFLLNPLVENAVKHGLDNSARPLRIRITAQLRDGRLLLEVANTGRLSQGGGGTKVGLRNIRERIEKIYGERGNFVLVEEDGWVCARISLG
jgi:two-component sensor histidine kinase